jgi:hypothetical protein
MSDSEDRDAILKRRAMFIASAVAGITLGACDRDASSPLPCLTVEMPRADGGVGEGGEGATGGGASDAGPVASQPDAGQEDEDAGAPPVPCLSIALPPDADAGAPRPQVCLSPIKPPPLKPPPAPPPQVCLKMAPPGSPSPGGASLNPDPDSRDDPGDRST